MTLSIGIAGISGRMGRLVVEEVAAAGAILAGGLALPEAMPEMPGVFLTSDPDALFPRCRVVIDFTHSSAVARHAAAAAPPWRGLGAGHHRAVGSRGSRRWRRPRGGWRWCRRRISRPG